MDLGIAYLSHFRRELRCCPSGNTYAANQPAASTELRNLRVERDRKD
jgi:hypothetical protein